jgi:hypothetical protein
MGRRYRDSFVTPHGPDVVWEVLPAVIAACGFELQASSRTGGTVRAKKSMRNATVRRVGRHTAARTTFGEILRVAVRRDDAQTFVDLESRLVFGLIDWGENRRNVENLRAALAEALGPV